MCANTPTDLRIRPGTGVEVPVTKSAAVRLGVGNESSAQRPNARILDYGVTTNYWFNDTLGASLEAAMRQGRGNAHDEMRYTADIDVSFD